MSVLFPWIAAISSLAGLAASAVVAKTLLRYRPMPEESERPFSASRYTVLGRLGSETDLEFLRSMPGFRREMENQFRREQRRILRLYLREIVDDFRRLHATARALVAVAPAENEHLVGLLLQQQSDFWRGLALIEMRLLLSRTGASGVNLGGLIKSIESLRAAVAATDTAPMPA